MTKLQFRRGTAATWTSANPTLSAGEPGFETDTGKVKIGNGSTAWNSLAYVVPSGTPYTVGGTDVALADGGTGASLSDPGADRLLFWDDSAGNVDWLTLGTNLSISGTTINASGGGGGGSFQIGDQISDFTSSDGAMGQLRLSSSPYHFITVVYDATRAKWVTPQLLTNFSVKDSAITSTATSYGVFSDTEVTRTFIPFMKAMVDAGLSPEVCLVSQMFNSSGANTNFMQASFFDFDDGDTGIVSVGTGGEISNTSSTSGAPKYTTDGWEAVSITPTQTHGVMILQRKVSAGTGTFSVPQAWLRWVG